MPERAWTLGEVAEMHRLKTRAGYTWPMVAQALDRTLHSVKARTQRERRGRPGVKVPAVPRSSKPPWVRPYRALERALAAGRVHPIVLRLFREIVDRRLNEEELCRKAGVAQSCLRCWATKEYNPSLIHLASLLEAAGLKLVVEEMKHEDIPRPVPGRSARPVPGTNGGGERGAILLCPDANHP